MRQQRAEAGTEVDEVVWSAIRYLDPDARKPGEQKRVGDVKGFIAAVLLLVAFWAVLYFRLCVLR